MEGSGMKESEEDRLKYAVHKSTLCKITYKTYL